MGKERAEALPEELLLDLPSRRQFLSEQCGAAAIECLYVNDELGNAQPPQRQAAGVGGSAEAAASLERELSEAEAGMRLAEGGSAESNSPAVDAESERRRRLGQLQPH